jgi:hypothetical protein
LTRKKELVFSLWIGILKRKNLHLFFDV